MYNTVDLNKLSNAIKKNRNGLSYRIIAEAIGVTAGTVEKIEKGTTKPQLPTYILLCQWLKVDFDFFIKDTARPNATNKSNAIQNLKSDPLLDPKRANAIIEVIEMAYA